jgi:hypothetical protein
LPNIVMPKSLKAKASPVRTGENAAVAAITIMVPARRYAEPALGVFPLICIRRFLLHENEALRCPAFSSLAAKMHGVYQFKLVLG